MKTFTLLALTLAFASLAQEPPSRFRPALPGYIYEFPRDHGTHDDFRTEWWYYTGHLEAASGKEYGFEVTFFRVGVEGEQPAGSATAWDLRNIGLAHFAITDLGRQRFRYYEKVNRFSPFTAGARRGFKRVFNEGWSVVTLSDGSFRLRASAGGDAIDLVLRSEKPPAIHGENGISVKAEGVGYASHYYSLTRLTGSGSVTVEGAAEACSVVAWMDHEWGSAALRETQEGWDWFSLQFDNGTELMLYQIRRRDGTPDVTSSGSFVLVDGSVIRLTNKQFRIIPKGKWRSAKSGAVYPMGWRIEVPDLNLRLDVRERMRAQELITDASTQVTYWEGAVAVRGNLGQTSIAGRGYVELTGYEGGVVRSQ
jgi:predicted secreted hydrolase